MIGNVISKRYANALYSLASEKNQVDKTLEELKAVLQMYKESSEFRLLLKNPLVHKEDKKKIFVELNKNGYISDFLLSFMQILAEKNRLEDLINIIENYEDKYLEVSGEAVANVSSVIELDKDIREELSEKLSKITGKKVTLETTKNPELLGGFLAKIKSTQFDASIKGQMERLKEEMIG